MPRILASAFAIALISTSAINQSSANPAPIGSPGETLVPFTFQHLKDVEIAEEKLTIEDGRTEAIPSPSLAGSKMDVPCVRYQARYRFENTSGKPLTIKVGFPTVVYSELAGGSYGGLTSLDANYGGTKLVVHESSLTKPAIFPKQRLGDGAKYLESAGLACSVPESADFIDLTKLGKNLEQARANISKSTALPRAQKVRVLDLLRRNVFSESDESVKGQSLCWYFFQLHLPVGLSDNLTVSYNSFVPFGDDYSFSYILTTARLWNSQIKHLTIEILADSQFLNKGGTYEILPKGAFLHWKNPDRFVIKSENKMPDFDIYVKRIPKNN